MKRGSFLASFVGASMAILGGCGWLAGLKDLPVPPDVSNDADSAREDGEPSDDAPFDATDALTGGDGDDGGCSCLAIPAGWTGPWALYEGPQAIAAPSCAGVYGSTSFEGSAGLSAPVASCTACSCGPQTGAKCGAHLSYYTNACGSTLGGCGAEDYGLLAGACEGLGTGNGGCTGKDVQSFQADGVESQPGTCAPSTATPNGAAPSWQTSGVACGPSAPFEQGWCAAGQVCAFAPSSPFDKLCVEATGAQSCPSGTPFTTPHLYYTAFDDARGCGACTCSNPTVSCSPSGTVTFWTAFNCTGTPTGTNTLNDVNGSGCQTLPSMSYYSTYQPTSFVLGSCSPGGGAPTGSVTTSASTAVTFCCTQ